MKTFSLIVVGILIFLSCQKPISPPATPTILDGTAVSPEEIWLSWIDKSSNEQGFKIERKTGSGDFALVGSSDENVQYFQDKGLIQNTTYTYRVYAYNSAGRSSYSNESIVWTTGVPVLTTYPVTEITSVNATCGGDTNDGGSNVIARGVVWRTIPDPTIALSTKTWDGSGTGAFSTHWSGLHSSTTYYVN